MVCPPRCPQLSDLSGSLHSSQAGPCSVPWSGQEFSPPWHLCTCCPTAWTALPPCIFVASSLPSFRTFFKCYLLREVFSDRIFKVATPCIILSPFSVLFCSPSHLLTHYNLSSILLIVCLCHQITNSLGSGLCEFCSLLYIQYPKQCLAHCWMMNICWMHE